MNPRRYSLRYLLLASAAALLVGLVAGYVLRFYVP